jgi:hypothetical protein
MPVNYNKLDQSLDIKGSLTPDNAKTLADESNSIGAETQSGTGDTIGGTAPDMTLTDAVATFSAADVGRWITIAGAPTGANDGTLLSLYPQNVKKIGYDPAKNLAEEAKKHSSWVK